MYIIRQQEWVKNRILVLYVEWVGVKYFLKNPHNIVCNDQSKMFTSLNLRTMSFSKGKGKLQILKL